MKFFKNSQIILIIIWLITGCIRDPAPPFYGGKISIENASAYNLYVVFETIDKEHKKEVKFIVEKNDHIIIYHTFYGWEKEETIYISNPVNYYTNIFFYDLDNGSLLNSIVVNNRIFNITDGSIEKNDAVFQFFIDGNLLNNISHHESSNLIIGHTNKYTGTLNDNIMYYKKEKNISSYNIFLQCYFNDGNVYRIELLQNSESNSNKPYSRYPDKFPYWQYNNNPNNLINKVLLMELNSQKLLKGIKGNDTKNLYRFNNYDSVYGEKVQYFIFEITDDIFDDL
jgi:hypothetical protein